MCFIGLSVDVYAEEHARTALARGRQAAMMDTDIPPGLETHAVAVYNPAVVDFRPQVWKVGSLMWAAKWGGWRL